MAEHACSQLLPIMKSLQKVDPSQHASESFLSMCGRRERERGGEAAAFIASETWICTGAGGEPGRQKSLFSAGRANKRKAYALLSQAAAQGRLTAKIDSAWSKLGK